MLQTTVGVNVDAKTLKRSLTTVKPYTKQSYTPAVRLNGAGDWLWVQAGLGTLAQSPVEMDGEPIDVWVPPADLAALLPRNGTVNLHLDGDRLHVLQDGNGGSCPTLRAEDLTPALCFWPRIADNVQLIDIDRFALSHLAKACSQDQIRPLLATILIEVQNRELVAVATDSYWLLEHTADTLVDPDIEDTRFVVPRSAIDAHKPGNNATTKIAVGRSPLFPDYVCVESYDRHGLKLQTIDRHVDGTYPQYRSLVPDLQDALEVVDVDVESLITAAAACAAVPSKGSAVVLTLAPDGHPDGGNLAITVQDGGSASVNFDLRAPATQEWVGGFNPQFLLWAAQALPTETASMRFTSPLRPMLMVAADMRALLMPIRLNV